MLYDITPPITEMLAVWPGDVPMTRELLLDIGRGDAATVSTWRATTHLGAHADALSHIDAGGATIDAMDLHHYLGPCQVMRVNAKAGRRITMAMLDESITAPRVLLATGSYPDPETFTADFVGLDAELIDALAESGVITVGVDTPGVDPVDDAALAAHHRCAAHGMAILEGLRLDHVPAGRYELIALPLRLAGFDASPVRAVLRTFDEGGC
jgi:arylformamidase